CGKFVSAEDLRIHREPMEEEQRALEVLEPVTAPPRSVVDTDDRQREQRPSEEESESHKSLPYSGDTDPAAQIGKRSDAERNAEGGDSVVRHWTRACDIKNPCGKPEKDQGKGYRSAELFHRAPGKAADDKEAGRERTHAK